ncbi:TetR family transcriptional regulator [Niallia circulans]|nr:TetR/AcrR family transcriptional regulator C-terminal domain-containing protein [Niallia circulans]QJX61060.1 TetR family transcriptional regulator [Niallia circulans]
MKGKKTKITKENIIAASWRLLDKVGIEEFSMRKLAVELNIQAPSIYWYFKNKQSIFQSLANEIAKESILSTKLDGDWKGKLTQFAVGIKDTLSKYPCSAQLIMKTIPTEPDYMILINELLQVVDDLPMEDKDKFSSIMCLLNYVIFFELDKYEQKKTQLLILEEFGPNDVQTLFKRPFEQFPDDGVKVLKRLYNNDLFEEIGSDRMFENGLYIIISGIEQLIIKNSTNEE